MAPYSLSFKDGDTTTTVFRIADAATFDFLRASQGVDVWIDTSTQLQAQLPQRLDLGVSDVGIVGRQVTVMVEGRRMGMGIVGFD
ncbi:hypothetical protein EYZ11_004896 [Aspergillus tanneri]|uniref:Uncharacterized protein n=1 Tax=Aspergillus tanneri TaxID=1220188 RepID=A0A4V3UPL2_9EURO|nr:hypothetical protein EYZ11_004896 [Aspergillus tanneri]